MTQADGPVVIVAYFDPQCPYSHRAMRWLADLGPSLVSLTWRAFSLEQVNRDPSAEAWRIWEQELDYLHQHGRRDRRSLAAFLAVFLAEQAVGSAAADRLRLLISTALHRDGLDISDLGLLERLAAEAVPSGLSLAAAFADPARSAAARGRLEADWWSARYPVRIFGVPTLIIGGQAPVYLRLERIPEGPEGPELLDSVVALGHDFPFLLELKKPERA